MASILLEDCTLHLPIYGTINRSLKGAVMASATGGRIASATRNITVIEALRNISLEFRPGDRVGLVGHNGAGKTTLLRLIAGIYEPTSGRVDVQGRISSFINLGLGMDMEATGAENILLCGLMFGLDIDEINASTPAIREFSGLGDFLDMPVRTYSSGMLMRLVFSIVTSVHAEILLMDEWLSVGDADFVVHAEQRLRELVDRASILVLASHDAGIVDKLCNVVVHLEHGQVVSVTRKPA
jgi:lipopolysaccharide transport system ATP-binding protein